MRFIHALAPAALGAAAGFRKPLYFISTGYGAAMTLQAVSAVASGRFAAADPLGKLHLAVVAAYGARLASFVLWRDSLPSFQNKKQEHDSKLEGISMGKKLGMWAGVTPLYWAMYLPAFINSGPAAGALASPAAKAFSLYVGAPLMLAGLVWEAVADQQQQAHHERQAGAKKKKPCTGGLWAYSRQANYLGEAAFWLGGYGSALRAYTSVPQALGAAVGVVGIVAIIASEMKRRSTMRERHYSGPEWEQYKQDTAEIVPFMHWLKSGGGTAAAVAAADKPEGFRL